MAYTRRRLLSAAVGVAGLGSLAGCIGDLDEAAAATADATTAQASFFVFGDVTANVAGDAADADLLVPVGQHGHGWEPGPKVREAVHDADLLVHGMPGFQPWIDAILQDLDADGSDVETVDVTADVDLLPAARHGDDHGEDEHDEDEHDDAGHEDEHDRGAGMDPHFWMDPLRVKDAVGNVREALSNVQSDGAEAFSANAEDYRGRLEALHERIEETVAAASTDVLLVAGHDSFQYFGERYRIDVRALTDVSPDDRPTAKAIERAQEIVEHHDVRYVCADPLASQEAAEQLVADTDAEAVLPLTAIPGLTQEWEDDDWGYVDVMENVNLPTLERALEA